MGSGQRPCRREQDALTAVERHRMKTRATRDLTKPPFPVQCQRGLVAGVHYVPSVAGLLPNPLEPCFGKLLGQPSSSEIRQHGDAGQIMTGGRRSVREIPLVRFGPTHDGGASARRYVRRHPGHKNQTPGISDGAADPQPERPGGGGRGPASGQLHRDDAGNVHLGGGPDQETHSVSLLPSPTMPANGRDDGGAGHTVPECKGFPTAALASHARKKTMTEQTIAPLDGVRVLELGNYIAAPTAGRLLADFGAEVIKVERPGTGDELRNWRLHKGTTSMLYRTLNRNKKSVVLDLRTDAGKQAVLELVAKCDILLENFRPGTLEKWGLGPEVLNEANPELIVTRISAFGQTGPLSGRPGFAAVAEAYGGFRNLVGDPDRAPVRVGVSIGDSIAGLYAAFGSVMSLFQREARRRDPGSGVPLTERVIDVALHEAMFSMMESLIPDYQAYGVDRQRVGGRMEGIAPSNAYVCGDGASIVVAGNGDSIFQRYMQTIGRPDLAERPDLQGNAGRWTRREELDQAIGEWTATLPAAEALAVLEAAGVPAGPIYTAADISDDSQYAARNMIQKFDVSTGEETIPGVGFPGIVPVIGGQSLPIRNLGPDLGENTQEILGGLLGMSAGQIDAASGREEAVRS